MLEEVRLIEMKKENKFLKELDQPTFERIERYLLGEMTIAEKTQFELEIANNEALQNEVKLQRQMIAGIQVQSVDLQDTTSEEYARGLARKSFDNSRKIHRLIVPLLGIAAGIVLVAVVGYFWMNSNQDLYAKYYEADPGLPTIMGVADNYEFQDAMVDYKMEDYQKAKEKWQKLTERNSSNDTLNYYIAMADLNLNNFEKSAQSLNQISTKSSFYADALWYQALIAIHEKDYDLAREKLETLDSDRAKILLSDLNNKK